MGKLFELIKNCIKALSEDEPLNENDLEYQEALSLAEHNDPMGYYRLFILNRDLEEKERTITIDSQEQIEKEKKYCQIGANNGDKYAQCNLGILLFGDGNVNDAAKWLIKSAEQGVPWAQGFLGFFYACGVGVEKDFDKSEKWLKMAINQEVDIKAKENAIELLNKLDEEKCHK
jgi:TPR repeat protein